MIESYVIDDIRRYSYITDAYRRGIFVYVVFDNDEGKEVVKRIRFTANKPTLQKFLRKIKKISEGTQLGKKTKIRPYIRVVA